MKAGASTMSGQVLTKRSLTGNPFKSHMAGSLFPHIVSKEEAQAEKVSISPRWRNAEKSAPGVGSTYKPAYRSRLAELYKHPEAWGLGVPKKKK